MLAVRAVLGTLLLLLAASPAWAGNKTPRVALETNMGQIVVRLDAEKAPKSTANFLKYVDAGFYDGTIFHRVIINFMIQGGGYGTDAVRKKPGTAIKNESKNGLKNKRGTIAMARTGEPHSGTSQWFINVVDNASLDFPSFDGWGYAVFGEVIEGMEVVDRIRKVKTGACPPEIPTDCPLTPAIIEKARRL